MEEGKGSFVRNRRSWLEIIGGWTGSMRTAFVFPRVYLSLGQFCKDIVRDIPKVFDECTPWFYLYALDKGEREREREREMGRFHRGCPIETVTHDSTEINGSRYLLVQTWIPFCLG